MWCFNIFTTKFRGYLLIYTCQNSTARHFGHEILWPLTKIHVLKSKSGNSSTRSCKTLWPLICMCQDPKVEQLVYKILWSQKQGCQSHWQHLVLFNAADHLVTKWAWWICKLDFDPELLPRMCINKHQLRIKMISLQGKEQGPCFTNNYSSGAPNLHWKHTQKLAPLDN